MKEAPKPPAKRGRGRPPSGDVGRDTQVTAKMTRPERETCKRAAQLEGKSLSEWARDAMLLRAAAHG